FYVDTPTDAAQEQMMAYYTGLPQYDGYDFGEMPECRDLTGRDISNMCEKAWRQELSLKEATDNGCVPILRRNPEMVAKLRDEAHNSYLSAQIPGVYRKHDSDAVRKEELKGRRITWGDEEDEGGEA
ncbi:hypothetical protein LCGC14_2528140, partial [marine sediment metagenome]